MITHSNPLDVTIIGGGMITELQILPSMYHLERLGAVKNITCCSLTASTMKQLALNPDLKAAFPGQSFAPYPNPETNPLDEPFPELYKKVVADMKPFNVVVIALPDQMHYKAILWALEHNQHVLCVKPLVLQYSQAKEIENLALEKGLFVGVEYHKRFDDRVSIARYKYKSGHFGEFRIGMASLVEPWYYRNSNFQNWCTTQNSDMFTYIGCHYVDQVHMITGLLPVQVSVYGIIESYPNGNKGYLWTDGRVIWENDACLSVINGMGYPNAGPGGNSQGMWLFTQGIKDGGFIFHDDQYRGVKHSYIEKSTAPGETYYNEPSPDYFQLIERGQDGLIPVGYGYTSIEALVQAVLRVNGSHEEGENDENLKNRQKTIKTIDKEGFIATPANSYYNELVIEAARLSIQNGGRDVVIEYDASPRVRFKESSEYN